MANQQAYLLDSHLQPVLADAPGEIHYGGAGLARGYLNRPALTAEKFIPDLFGGQAGARLYKTNDLARFRADGEVELIGRMDFQVKIRGMRVDLEEIAATLRQSRSVREAVVTLREDEPDNKRLVAYVIPDSDEGLDFLELRRSLKESLPEYMTPATFVAMDAFPLSPNGKMDRRALPAPGRERPELLEAFVAPRTPIEEVVADVWSDLLGVEQVGIHDNFIELGGHSLLATRLAARLQEVFSIEAPLRALFESPTVAQQCEQLESLGRAARRDVTKIAQLLIKINGMSDSDVQTLLAKESN
jgi:acyl carrier protein